MRRDFEAVKAHGLRVRSCNEDFHLERVNCYGSAQEMGPVDLVFVGLKTTANGCFEELVTPLMGPDTVALTAQNGLGNDERLAELFGPERVAGGLAFLCSNRLEPGVIHHLDYGHMHVGSYQSPPAEKVRQFAQMLCQSGVDCKVVDNLALAQWRKLVWNVPFNGLSALLDITVDRIMADGQLRQRAEYLMREVQAGAQTQGLEIKAEDIAQMLKYTDEMEPYYTSMHLDARNGQPMEVEAIIGEPLRRGQRGGAAMREMARLYEGLSALDRANQS